MVISILDISYLDYCNMPYKGLFLKSIWMLQLLQIVGAQVVMSVYVNNLTASSATLVVDWLLGAIQALPKACQMTVVIFKDSHGCILA